LTEISKKTIEYEYNLTTATADVTATMKIDMFGGVLAFGCKITSEDGMLYEEDIQYVTTECFKTAREQGYLPKSKQTKLDKKQGGGD
jgi:hypothetical protein